MKIAVISDSHYIISSVEAVKEHLKDVDVILHCGDGAPDLKELTKDLDVESYGVRGNCDITNEYPSERILELGGKTIFMCHGHRYGVKSSYNNIYYKGKECNADIVLFGHSHLKTIMRENGLVLMNPGSITSPAMGNKKSMGFIIIEENKEIELYLKEI